MDAEYQIEGLSVTALKKTYKRLKKHVSKFKKMNASDILDYIDYEVELEQNLKNLIKRIQNGEYKPKKPALNPFPKSKGINRPTVTLDIEDSIVYRFCLEQIDEELLDEARRKNIRGGLRASPNLNPDADEFYEKWFKDWQEHNEELTRTVREKRYVASTDVASYFENVDFGILKELVRNSVQSKPNLINLLFYFLENTKLTYGYSDTLNTGLLQEDIDCSRTLAYFYLYPHDKRMIKWCGENDAVFFRYVDDMSIVVNSIVDAKKALKTLTESLRQLGLVASIEKTEILSRKNALKELFDEENKRITTYQDRIYDCLYNKTSVGRTKSLLERYYNHLIAKKAQKRRAWAKVLTRFYSLVSQVESDILINDVGAHIIKHPGLVTKRRITKYLHSCINAGYNVRPAITAIINYLKSDENLYPAVESELLDLLGSIEVDIFTNKQRTELKSLAFGIAFDTEPDSPRNDTSKANSVLLLYKLDQDLSDFVADRYLNNDYQGIQFKKALLLFSLLCPDEDKCKLVLRKAETDPSNEIKRTVGFISNLDSYRRKTIVRNFIKKQRLYTLYDTEKYEIEVSKFIEYMPAKNKLLSQLVEKIRP